MFSEYRYFENLYQAHGRLLEELKRSKSISDYHPGLFCTFLLWLAHKMVDLGQRLEAEFEPIALVEKQRNQTKITLRTEEVL